MKDPSFNRVRMPGVGKHPDAVATIGWNPDIKRSIHYRSGIT